MNLIPLVLVNLGRNKRRTLLTLMSVIVALFLFCALGGVLDTLEESIKVSSRARLVTRNKISLIFPLPLAYKERIAAVPGVKNVAIQNWFGGQDPKDPHNFFAQFAVDDPFYQVYARDMDIVQATPPQAAIPVPPGIDPKLADYLTDQTACVVGLKLMEKNGWKVGQNITLSGTIYPGKWPFVIRAVYKAKQKSFGDETMFFHWKYLSEQGMRGQGFVGVYILDLSDPSRAGDIARQVDAMYENSAAITLTESEQALLASLLSVMSRLGSAWQMPAARGLTSEPVAVGVTVTTTVTVALAGRVTLPPLAEQLRLLVVIEHAVVPVAPPALVAGLATL